MRDYDYYKERPGDLSRLSDMSDWHVREGDPDIRGWDVHDQDGKEIGKVDDLLVSTEAGRVVFAIVRYGGLMGLGGEETLVPLDKLDVDRDNKRINYHGTVDDLKLAPRYTKDTTDYGRFYDHWSEKREAVAGREEHREERREAVTTEEERREAVTGREKKPTTVRIFRGPSQVGETIDVSITPEAEEEVEEEERTRRS